MNFQDFFDYLDEQNQIVILFLSLLIMAGIGLLDYWTGYELSFSVFYVLPIAIIVWFSSKQYGILVSLLGAVVWLWADSAAHTSYSSPFIPLWNSAIRFFFFLIITLLLASLRGALKTEKSLARSDSLTGAANSLFFYEALEREIERSQRYKKPFSLAYVDLDNFKKVNDKHGHLVGDNVLRRIVNYAKNNLRSIDTIARLGGDEFAFLLPETNQNEAQVVFTKLQKGLLVEMQQNGWPISFSFGVVTCEAKKCSSEELVSLADNLMYTVKRRGKNALIFSTFKDDK